MKYRPFAKFLAKLPRVCLFIASWLFVCLDNCKAQSAVPYNWGNVAIGGGGFVSAVITSKEQPDLMYARTDVGGAYRWDNTKQSWVPLMDWASEQQQGMFGVESIAIDPQSPNIVYASAGISYFNNGRSYLLRSTDYGANFSITEVSSQFKIHGNGMGRQNGEKLQVDPNNSAVLYCGTRWNGLFKSTNSGASWIRVASLDVTTTPNENGVSLVVLDKSSLSGGVTQRLFVGVSRTGSSQNFYKSEDAGATFTPVVNASLGANLMPQRAVLTSEGNLFVTYANGAGPHGTATEPMDKGEIWKYNVTAGTWTNVTPSGFTRAFSGISVDPSNPQRLIASSINTYLQQGSQYGDRFFISTNGGTSWTDIIAGRGFVMDNAGVPWVSGSSIHWAGSIEFDPANANRVLVTSGNGIFVNENVNTSNVWKFFVKGLEETVPLNAVSIPGGPLVTAIGDYDGFVHTDITKYSTRHNPEIGTTTGLDYAAANTSKLIRVGDANKFYYSANTGTSWNKTSTMNGKYGNVAISANGNVILHSPDGSSTTYRSTDNGSSWTAVTGITFSNARPVADGANSNKFYAYNNSSAIMMVSTDGGATFTSGGNPGNGGSRIIRTVPDREGHIWVATFSNGLSRSVNSGTSFSKINSISYCSAVGIGKAAPGSSYETIYIYGTVGGVLGIFRSVDEGASWVRVNDDAHEYGGPGNGQFVIGDMNVFGRVYMSTAGRGLVYGDPAPANQIILTQGNFSVTENAAAGTVIGIPSPADQNQTNLHNWSILSGNENNVFTINSTTGSISVAAGATIDYETLGSYTLDLGFLDKNETNSHGEITITVNNVNEAPADILLSKTDILQQNSIGQVVGDLTTIDPDQNSTFTYSLVSGSGSADNSAFTISGNQLKAATVFNYDAKKAYNIRIRSTDNGSLSIEKELTINVRKAGVLPVNNLQVKASNEVCAANNDGKITVSAATALNYKATLTSGSSATNYTFTQNLDISSLAAGNYSLCISSDEASAYNRCFNLVISEPAALSVYSFLDEENKVVQLNFSGSDSYYVELNGQKFSTKEASLSLPLNEGINSLSVSTDANCQGVFSRTFAIGMDKKVYPNPFKDVLHLYLGDQQSVTERLNIKLYSVAGAEVFSKDISAENSIVQLNLGSLPSGVYVVKVRSASGESTFRVVKK